MGVEDKVDLLVLVSHEEEVRLDSSSIVSPVITIGLAIELMHLLLRWTAGTGMVVLRLGFRPPTFFGRTRMRNNPRRSVPQSPRITCIGWFFIDLTLVDLTLAFGLSRCDRREVPRS